MLTWIDEPLHPVYKNASPQAFHDFVLDRIEMHRKCFKDWSVRHCAYNGSLYKNAVSTHFYISVESPSSRYYCIRLLYMYA